MTLDVDDWFRSVTVLGIACVTVIAVTIGLATIIVPAPAVSSQPSAGASVAAAASEAPTPTGTGQVGGTISVSGDRSDSFAVVRESTEGRYALVGDDGRIYFDTDPLSVAQISFHGLEFFVDPGDCSISAGERDDETGVAPAHVRCEAIEEVRGNGVMTLDGTVGIAADLLGLRGGLPETGGILMFGDRRVVFEEAAIAHPRFSSYLGQLVDVDGTVGLTISYDSDSDSLVVDEIIAFGEAITRLSPDACRLSTTEIGLLNPHTRLLELSVECPAIDLSSAGAIAVSGTLIVEEVDQLF